MKNEQFIFGKELSQSEMKKISKHIESWQEAGKQKLEGEYEKSQEDIIFIQLINSYLQQEMRELGIDNLKELNPNQFHLMSKVAYEKIEPNENFIGITMRIRNAVYINKDAMTSRPEYYKTILHEAIHLVSFEKYQVVDKLVSNYRSGYLNETINKDEFGQEHEHFRGLNEAISDLIVMDITKKHREEMIAVLGIDSEEEKISPSFARYKDLIVEIIYKVAEKQGEKYVDVWKMFKRGYFIGEIMHLRSVEKTFGKGSLRFLSAICSGMKGINKEIEEKINMFFQIENESEREKIAREILNDREWKSYLKRTEL